MLKLFPLLLAALLLGLTHAAQAAPSWKNVKTRADLRQYLQQGYEEGNRLIYRPYLAQHPDDALAKEENEVWRLMLDINTKPEVAARRVVTYLRHAYASPKSNQKIDLLTPSSVGSTSPFVLEEIPMMLFLLKDRMDGLYEWTWLTGDINDALRGIWELPFDWKSDTRLFNYYLYTLMQSDKGALTFYRDGSWRGSPSTEAVVDLIQKFGLKQPRIEAFLLDFPFQPYGSFQIGEMLRKEGRADLKSPHLADQLADYYRRALAGTSLQIPFLQRVNQHFGAEVFAAVLTKLFPDKATTSSITPAFWRQLHQLALNANALPWARRIEAKLPGDATLTAQTSQRQKELANLVKALESPKSKTP